MSHATTAPSSETAVVLRVAARLEPGSFSAPGVDDPSVLGPLESQLTRVPHGGSVIVGSEADVLTELGSTPQGPVVLLVEATGLAPSIKPTWHPALVSAGYVGCLATAGWRLYVHADASQTLGADLSYPATDAERDAQAEHARQALLAEIVQWRTAALTRWSVRAYEESGKTNKELVDELARATSMLETIHRTFSWRVTAPLRAVQTARLRSARR
ncbi:hypothetical protein [Cellulomonas soli]